MVTVKPKADWILFKAVTIKTSSGIILPDKSKLDNKLVRNMVRAVGPKVKTVKPGEEIILLPHARLELGFPERDMEPDLFVTREQEVCAEIREEQPKEGFLKRFFAAVNDHLFPVGTA